MRPRPLTGRAAGLVVPLFSLRSRRSWGIGDIGDLGPLARWLERAGLRALQLLPVSTLPLGQSSPYSALSAMAIDPIFISLPDVRDFEALGGDVRLPLADQITLRSARSAPTVQYSAIRQVKESALRLAFSLFWEVDWLRTTARAGAFAAFCSWEDWWLGDYALYAALRERQGGAPWTEWPEPLRAHGPHALEEVRRELEQEILFQQYMQWLADEQWEGAREAMGDVRLFGDFPFMVASDSADVWARQDLFRFDRTVGTPPDAFSETGQDWGLPVYRWDAMAEDDYRWLRQRTRRMCRLYDGYRVDHLVGFFRTYSRPLGSREGAFEPEDEPSQIALGERLLTLFQEGGAHVTAEDLGLVPDFVRASLAKMRIPGYKVIRWERDWHASGHPFLAPSTYPPVSVVTTSTHDIEPLELWWEQAPDDERQAFAELLAREAPAVDTATLRSVAFTTALRDGILSLAYGAASELLLLPVQDAFGWRDRINVPGTVGADNWTWRMPLAIDDLDFSDAAIECAARLRTLAASSARNTIT